MTRLRIVFMGTPGLAAVSLEALLRQPDFELLAVVTQPDRPKGRELKLQPSPVKEIASRSGLRVLQPAKARDETFVAGLRALKPDLIAVAAFGQLLPQAILDLPTFGCINLHTSLLPKYRGASPIQAALLHGDSETGVTIMKMDAGLDTGGILSQERTVIRDEDDAQLLHDRLAQLGAELLVKTIPDYVAGKVQPRPQPFEGVSYAPKIKKENGRIDWTLPARAIWNRIRAFTPWPGAFTYFVGVPHSGDAHASRTNPLEGGTPAEPPRHLLKIWKASVVSQSGKPGEILRADKGGLVVACGEGALQLDTVQREGGRRMSAQEFLAGHPLGVHTNLA